MVRTFKTEKTLSPWEKAMKNADSEEGRPVNTGKRVYADMRVTRTSIEHHGTPRSLKLPPITEDPQQMIQFLGEEVGKAFKRSKEKIKMMKKEFILYDPQQTNLMNKNSAFDILNRYKVPDNENYQKKLLAFFVDKNEPSKIDHKALSEFFENSRKNYLERLEVLKQNEDQQVAAAPTDNTHGRYDSSATMNAQKNKPRKAHEQAFKERRDVGLMLEIEKALKGFRGSDPEDLLDELEESLRRTCRNDDFQTDNGHVRSLVNKHGLPINTALTLKCIDRLDPCNTGNIEWPKFMAFLRKALGVSPRQKISKGFETPKHLEEVPQRPAWETRQPLSGIGSQPQQPQYDHSYQQNGGYSNKSNTSNGNDNVAQHHDDNWSTNKHTSNDPWQKFRNDDAGYHSNPSDLSPPQQYQYDDNNYNDNNYNNDGGYYNNDGGYYDNGVNQPANEEEFPQMDDDLEAAFAKGVDELRSHQPVEEERQTFEDQGQRGNIYRMVASALEDKSKLNNGRIHTNEVRKIMNYYNLLFDANFPMDQVNSILNRNSQHDEVYSDQIISMFGKEIV